MEKSKSGIICVVKKTSEKVTETHFKKYSNDKKVQIRQFKKC